MLHSPGQRACRYLIVALTFVSPLSAYGEIKLAPVVDLNPRYQEPASSELEEPGPLVGTAKAIPLSDAGSVAALPHGQLDRQNSPVPDHHSSSIPAIKFVKPFDLTRPSASQSTRPANALTLAPVIKVHEPIRPRGYIGSSQAAPSNTNRPTELDVARRMGPGAIPVHRSIFVATRGVRLERAFKSPPPIAHRQDRIAKQLMATLNEMTREALQESIAASKQNKAPESLIGDEVTSPKLSGFIQLADQDPISQQAAAQDAERSKQLVEATPQPKRTPIVVQATQPTIDLARLSTKALESEPEELASSKAPTVPNSDALDIAKAIANKPAIVGVVANPLATEIALESKAKSTDADGPTTPIVLPATDTLVVQKDVEPSVPAPTGAVSTRQAVVALAESGQWLAALQQPSASNLPAPTNELELTEEQRATAEEIAAIEDGLKPIGQVFALTKPEAGELPKNYAAMRFAQEGQVAHRMGFSRAKAESEMMWEAPAVAHRPLYFEDINLERHGYKIPLVQPAMSAAHFFGRVPLLPYLAASEGHRKPQYTLGHYRPGDYAPYSLYVPRLKLDGSLAEAAFITGVLFAFP